MHPILFRIPLPSSPIKVWWLLVAVAAIVLLYAFFALRRGERTTALVMLLVIGGLGFGAYRFRESVVTEADNLPIYSYGVMLGISLVIGWYLTLKLAEKDGLPKDLMANCYVITALAAIVGSRVLYIVTNLGEFKELGDIFALRKGGLVAYGGFIGGFLGSWAYLSAKKIRLMPWADVAVPSLASGLLVTRIGCYLYGCDFGRELPEGAPAVLKTLGSFPHWTEAGAEGSPAWLRHEGLATKLAQHGDHAKLDLMNQSQFAPPVHPTQLYESLVGLSLLVLLLLARRRLKFRGQIFFLFVFAYGLLRFILEIWRDDPERGTTTLSGLTAYIVIPLFLFLFAVGYAYGVSRSIKSHNVRLATRIFAFAVPVAAFILMKPAQFTDAAPADISTSQWIGLATALAASYFFARYWDQARTSPQLAMALGEGATAPAAATPEKDEGDAEVEESDETRTDTPVAKKKKKKKKPAAIAEGGASEAGESTSEGEAAKEAEPAAEAPRVEAPKVEEPKVEEPKTEAPADEAGLEPKPKPA